MAITKTLVVLLILLALMVGVVLLQIYLSKMESKWPGLVLPALTGILALLSLLGLLGYAPQNNWESVRLALTTLLVQSIPTVILLGIYFACREKRRVNDQLEKMNIQDLE